MNPSATRAWIFAALVLLSTLASKSLMPGGGRIAQTADFHEGSGLEIAMIGDSTIRDFSVRSAPGMWLAQWFGNRKNPFLNTSPNPHYSSIFERLRRLAPIRAVELARGGASVGPARTWWRRKFQWAANIKTLEEQISELLVEKRFPDLTLLWIGHNNLDFVTQLGRFSPRGDLDEACEGLRRAFVAQYRTDLERLVRRAQAESHRSVIIVYGLVNPTATRHAREVARRLHEFDAESFPYLEKAEAGFPPLKAEYGDRLEKLSLELSSDLATLVGRVSASLPAKASRVRLVYSDATVKMDFSRPEDLSGLDAWHASDLGKGLIADALYGAIEPELPFLGVGSVKPPRVIR